MISIKRFFGTIRYIKLPQFHVGSVYGPMYTFCSLEIDMHQICKLLSLSTNQIEAPTPNKVCSDSLSDS